MLTSATAPGDRPRLEGLGELSMGAAAAAGGAAGGPIVAYVGYPTLAICGAAAAALIPPLLLITRRSRGGAGHAGTVGAAGGIRKRTEPGAHRPGAGAAI